MIARYCANVMRNAHDAAIITCRHHNHHIIIYSILYVHVVRIH